jgi:hypothetical protein
MDHSTLKRDGNAWPKLIKDEPASVDRFDSFGRMAGALRDMVRETSGGKTVCLNGAWGSGKSTFIKILEAKFLEVDETSSSKDSLLTEVSRPASSEIEPHVFVYDAWAHSGDPLRRAFLSRLLKSLWHKAQWLTEAEKPIRRSPLEFVRSIAGGSKADRRLWKGLELKLAGRLKETSKTSSFELGLWGRILLAAGFVWALKGSLVKTALAPFVGKSLQTQLISWLPAVFQAHAATIGSWLVLVAACGTILLSRGLSAVMANKGTVSERVSTSDEPVPTSIEFAEYFTAIVGAALTSHPNRRLILVLDNLDRLEKAERDNAWAFLRSFIDNSTIAAEAWYERVWVIVPWAAPIAEPEDATNEGSGKGTLQNGVTMEEGLAEKLFQIKLDLPPPTLYHWEKSLEELLSAAFSRSSTSFQSIVRLFHMMYDRESQLTMRRIVRFVNDLVVLAYQWNDVPLERLAAYLVAGGRDGVIRKLRSGESFDDLRRLADGDDESRLSWGNEISGLGDTVTLSERFAMLHYGLPDATVAMNRALAPEWERILRAGKLEEALQLLRSKSSVNALRLVATDFWRWFDKNDELFNTFRILAALLRVSNAEIDSSLARLRSDENWLVIARGACDAMRFSSPIPLSQKQLHSGYDAFLFATRKNPIARRSALQSIANINEVTKDLADISLIQASELLSKRPLIAELAVMDQPFVLPFSGKNYLSFCESALSRAKERLFLSQVELYEAGFGRWLPKDGWARVIAVLKESELDYGTATAFPFIFRMADSDVIEVAFEAFVAAVPQTSHQKDEGERVGAIFGAGLKYFLAVMGAEKVLELVAEGAHRAALLVLFGEMDTPDLPLSVGIEVFLMLLASASQDPIGEDVNDSEGDTPQARCVGASRFSERITNPLAAREYGVILEKATGISTAVDPSIYKWNCDDTEGGDVMRYWERIGTTVRDALILRYPRPTNPEETSVAVRLFIAAREKVSKHSISTVTIDVDVREARLLADGVDMC